jgi:putative transposase
MCNLLGVSRSGYYAWRNRPPSRHTRDDERLLAQVRQAFEAGRKLYGYRRVHARLETDIPCGRDRVARLMRENGLTPRRKRAYRATTQSGHTLPVAPNLLARDFKAKSADTKWVADITYIPTDEGRLYLAAIEDLFSRYITGWALEPHMTDLLTRKSLQMALGLRQPVEGMIFHSDRGSQYASDKFRLLLATASIVQSMSRPGNAYDNAPMESFFSRFKSELLGNRHFRTRDEARRDIFEYIEVFYNRQRAHSALGYRSPLEFEALHLVA